MFQVGDKVRNRYSFSDPFVGVVVAVNGRWITVKHDKKKRPPSMGDRFDYSSDELEHVNLLLRVARSI